jgi:hypothetical protein
VFPWARTSSMSCPQKRLWKPWHNIQFVSSSSPDLQMMSEVRVVLWSCAHNLWDLALTLIHSVYLISAIGHHLGGGGHI